MSTLIQLIKTYIAPSQFEAGFVVPLHTDEVVTATIDAAQVAFRAAV